MTPLVGPTRRDRLIRLACAMALIGLALMVWSLVDPRATPVLIGLSVGQVIGTLSFVLYLLVVAADLGIERKLRKPRAEAGPTAETSPPVGEHPGAG